MLGDEEGLFKTKGSLVELPPWADDDDLLFVLAETTNSLPLYTRLGTPSRDIRKKTRVMMLLSCSLW